jgi:hypothetical protein
MLRPEPGETGGERARDGAFAARTGGDDENGGHEIVSVLNKDGGVLHVVGILSFGQKKNLRLSKKSAWVA